MASSTETVKSLPEVETEGSKHAKFGMPALFAVLLAIVTIRHEMFRDELQAWLIARDSHSILEVFHNLRYEGHPALWQLILYLPSHISWNPVSMQWINFVFAVCEAFLILSFRKLHLSARVLITFSFFVFYDFGAIARNYMLSALLLTGATKCMVEGRHRVLGVVLLALAINAHFFAIPIALLLFAFLYWRELVPVQVVGVRISTMKAWAGALVLALATLAAYSTLRPPIDSYTPHYTNGSLNSLEYVFICIGRAWKTFIPLPEPLVRSITGDILLPRDSVSIAACLISGLVFTTIAGSLRSLRARCFFLAVTVVSCVLFGITVHLAPMRHYGFIFFSYVLALVIDTESAERVLNPKPLLGRTSSVLTIACLGVQSLAGLAAAGSDVMRPYSEAKDVSAWLKQQDLVQNPLVIQPDNYGPSLIGYMQRASAYYPACGCDASFLLWNKSRNTEKTVTEEDLSRLRSWYRKPVVLITTKRLEEFETSRLHLVLLRSFSRATIYPDEVFYVYMQAE